MVEKITEESKAGFMSPNVGFGGNFKRSMNDMTQAGYSPLLKREMSANSSFTSAAGMSGNFQGSDSSANSSFKDLVASQ